MGARAIAKKNWILKIKDFYLYFRNKWEKVKPQNFSNRELESIMFYENGSNLKILNVFRNLNYNAFHIYNLSLSKQSNPEREAILSWGRSDLGLNSWSTVNEADAS